MKSLLITIILVICLFDVSFSQDIYSIKVKNIDGSDISLQELKGKKILFVIAPVTEGDIRLNQLAGFQRRYANQIRIFAIPALDEGFTLFDKARLVKIYRDLSPDIVISEPVHVKKSSGGNQSPLIKWLTDKDLNRKFNLDVRGEEHKFFVDEAGQLYASIGPEFNLNAPFIETIMSKPVVGQ